MYANIQELVHQLRQPLGIIEALAYCAEMRLQEDVAAISELRQIRLQVEIASQILTTAIDCERLRGGNGAWSTVKQTDSA
jgi:hypothetical protein